MIFRHLKYRYSGILIDLNLTLRSKMKGNYTEQRVSIGLA